LLLVFPIGRWGNNLSLSSGRVGPADALRQVSFTNCKMAPLSMFNRWTIFALIAVAVVSRLLPHPPNFAFLGALGLFAGCHFRGSKVLLVPLAALLISDTIGHFAGLRGMGFYHPTVMVCVYAGIALSGLIGVTLRDRRSALRIGTASLACSTTFFLLSNFGVWIVSVSPATLPGLLACYTAALPFFQCTLAGDLFYSTLTFGSLALWQSCQSLRLRRVPARVAL
jgi:hypothetical protein